MLQRTELDICAGLCHEIVDDHIRQVFMKNSKKKRLIDESKSERDRVKIECMDSCLEFCGDRREIAGERDWVRENTHAHTHTHG